MPRVSRSGLAILAVLAILVGTAPMVLAATQGSCTSTDTTKIRLYENTIGDIGDGDDSLWKCGADSNLGDDPHNPAGNCHSPFFGSSTWNDCVSSYTAWVPAGSAWCFYRDANYANWFDHRGGAPSRYNLTESDVLSSLRIITPGTCNF